MGAGERDGDGIQGLWREMLRAQCNSAQRQVEGEYSPAAPGSPSDSEEEDEEAESSEEEESEESDSVKGEGVPLLTVLSPGCNKPRARQQ